MNVYNEKSKQRKSPRASGKKYQEILDRIFVNRVSFLVIFMFLCFSILIATLMFLQVLNYGRYATQSESNRIKFIPLPPARGLIYDRNGVLLATSVISNNLTITLQDIELPIDDIIAEISKIITLSPQNIIRFKRLSRDAPRQNPLIIKDQLSDAEINTLSVDLYKIKGVEISSQATRIYPFKESAVHALGYVARIDKKHIESIKENNLQDQYIGLTHIGVRGVEASFEDLLRGKMGFEKVETNRDGRIVRKINRTDPIPGQHLYLSLDIRLQAYAEKILGNYKGSIVALDPKTGEVLAFVSKPMFDPNLFVNGISTQAYKALDSNPSFPFLNRVMRGRYPPGSAIKPQIGIAGLELGTITRSKTTFCPGYYSAPNSAHKFRDWKKSGHGFVNLSKAIQVSCDVFFYDLALNTGIEPLTDFLKKFALGEPTGIDLSGEFSGIAPTPSYKKRTSKQPWYPGDTITAGIGQSFWLVTPLQVAQATAIISMKGHAFKPRMLYATRDPGLASIKLTPANPTEPIILKDPRNWDYMIASMVSVVHSPAGTARRLAAGINYQIAGKTGTAQVRSIAQGRTYDASRLAKKHHDHAWFTGFAPANNPKIAIAVIVENGGSGSGVAGPIAKNIMNAWITNFKDVNDTLSLNEAGGE
ncbi:penicillin-binding protein 2 [Gammaproteobacteria bacterium]|nr:penicillin-binding protein 2 [Gammaproteobacteria bacterium]